MQLGRKAWTAYVRTVIIALIILLFIPAAFAVSWIFGLVILIISQALAIYRILILRSYKLYCDENGVWLFTGILPWDRGIVGVKWRDLDEAAFYPTFWSWLFNSFSIRLGHRFTKSSEIFISHMKSGKDSVAILNARHQELIRNKQVN
ncbi:hypothetical protein [Undibacterium sp. Ji49W]|uniref:hypothetical protein n=1 Tax=Undibacterium sp. Ji49W TaxID=3413040 RepID=UPI003BF07999